MRRFSQDSSERIAEKGASPEFEAGAGSGFAANVAVLVTHTIHHRDIDAVRNRVRALNRAPGIVLGVAELGFLCRVPADRSGIKENLRALQGGEARSLRIPLVPANQRTDFSRLRVERAEAEIAGGEVKLFVIKRVVRNVHFAVKPA